MIRGENLVPVRFDLSALVRRSVATFYSHLVTRHTGQALRIGIESQIKDMQSLCLSILDFSQVAVLDYSCADETVAKLLRRYQEADRPVDAYFIARGVSDRHRDALEEVLKRHGLALVAEVDGVGATLLGAATPEERAAWQALEGLVCAPAATVAARVSMDEPTAACTLDRLADRRIVLRRGSPVNYYALSPLARGA